MAKDFSKPRLVERGMRASKQSVRQLSCRTPISLVVFGVVCAFSGAVAVRSFEGMRLRNAQVSLLSGTDALATALTEVQQYKSDVKMRVTALQTVLADAAALDFHLFSGPAIADLDYTGTGLEGAGGGDMEEDLGMFYDKGMLARSSAGKAAAEKPLSYTESIDILGDKLRYIPIGSPVEGRITSTFGNRRHPISRNWHQHHGIDLAVDNRAPVASVADGTVIKAGWKGGYGRAVVIDHGNGIQTVYGHLSRISVNEGEKLCRGQLVGLIGSTGRSTGPHMHYEVRVNGKPVDPTRFMKLAGMLKLVG